MTNHAAQRVFFAHNGPGPYACVFCGDAVSAPWSTAFPARHAQSFVVHHLDENKQHNVQDNLAAAHYGCHTRHHMLEGGAVIAAQAASTEAKSAAATDNWRRGVYDDVKFGKPRTEEQRARYRIAANTPEGLEARSRGGKTSGRAPKSAETRAKISAAHLGKKLSPKHSAALHEGSRRRWAALRDEGGEADAHG